MLAFGALVGVAIGWFSYRCQSWFVDILMGIGAFVSASMYQLFPAVSYGAPFAAAARGSMSLTLDATGFETAPPVPVEDLPIWTRLALAIPSAALEFAVGFLVLFVAARLVCHVKARCYTDPPAELTREQLRAQLWAEMNYSDDLLERR